MNGKGTLKAISLQFTKVTDKLTKHTEEKIEENSRIARAALANVERRIDDQSRLLREQQKEFFRELQNQQKQAMVMITNTDVRATNNS